MTVLNEIDHLRSHLRRWMKPTRVGVGWRFWPARAEVRSEPVGVVGVIAPWNYPVNLALIPLATAIAAGNHVYLKPSEHTPRTTEFLRSLLAEVFPADRVAVAAGGADVAGAFAALPFDHLVFTGSTAVGRKVMAAAAPNLTPLTLELGGKSPAIVCARFPDRTGRRAARDRQVVQRRPDLHRAGLRADRRRPRDALAEALREQVRARYGDTGRCRRLHPHHQRRPVRAPARATWTMRKRSRPASVAADRQRRCARSACCRRPWCWIRATTPR